MSLSNPSTGAPKSTGDAETLEENFGHWLEQHGVILEQWEESKGFRAIIDLNKLKAAWLAHIDAAVREALINEWTTLLKTDLFHNSSILKTLAEKRIVALERETE